MPLIYTRYFRPKGRWPPDWKAAEKILADAMDKEVKPLLLEYFNRVVADWRNKPGFAAKKSITRTVIKTYVYPTGENAKIWRFVSGGTKPHRIPKEGTVLGYPLRFQWGGKGSYAAKTTTSGGYRGPGKVIGGEEVRFMHVNHPGNKPRNFEKHIARWAKPKYQRIMKNAVARAKRALGGGR